MTDLKPCPHCGGPVSIEDYEDPRIRERHRIICNGCGTQYENYTMFRDREGLIEKWNQRAKE